MMATTVMIGKDRSSAARSRETRFRLERSSLLHKLRPPARYVPGPAPARMYVSEEGRKDDHDQTLDLM
jgi:hypothetical protein